MASTERHGFLIDTNVLLDVATADPVWGEWSMEALARSIRTGPVFIDPLIVRHSPPWPSSHPTMSLGRSAGWTIGLGAR